MRMWGLGSKIKMKSVSLNRISDEYSITTTLNSAREKRKVVLAISENDRSDSIEQHVHASSARV
jgi:hypothetical protein